MSEQYSSKGHFNMRRWLKNLEFVIKPIEDEEIERQTDTAAEALRTYYNVAAYGQYKRGSRKPLIDKRKGKNPI